MIAKLIIDKTPDWPHALKYEEFLRNVVVYYRDELNGQWHKNTLHPYAHNRGVTALNICLGKSLEDITLRYLRAAKRFANGREKEFVRIGLDSFQLNYSKVLACLQYAYGLERNPTTKVKELCDAILDGKDIKTLQHETTDGSNSKTPKGNRR